MTETLLTAIQMPRRIDSGHPSYIIGYHALFVEADEIDIHSLVAPVMHDTSDHYTTVIMG